MQDKICITGLGVISSTGNNVSDNYISLKEGKTGITLIELLDTKFRKKLYAGEIKLTNNDLLKKLAYPEKVNGLTRTTLLGIIAAQEAVSDANINLNDENFKTAFISATTNGGMDITEKYLYRSENNTDFIHTHPTGDSANKICEYFDFSGYRTTINTACSSGANAIIHAIRLIRHKVVDRAVVGGTDALTKFTLNGFNSLMILDSEQCKPFDENRKGLNLGEGAGFIVLESEDSIKKSGNKAYCKIAGYANANDAFHQTASSPDGDGAYKAMSEALETSGFSPSDINYINAHGTGTTNNDLTEGKAIEKLFGINPPEFSSTKAFTGHTLGASAAIEAVFSAVAIQKGVIFPNLNISNHISEINIKAHTKFSKKNINTVLSNSFGFGGNNSTLIFSKH